MRVAVVFLALVSVAACTASESGDLCDDDIDNDGDGKFDCADTDCILAPLCQPCGDGALDDTEACDDGNNDDDDGCSSTCILEGCGDGVRDEGEQCDDGNLVPADGCNFRCELSFCGNGEITFSDEECDDGNTLSGDGCTSGCLVERGGVLCGNGQFDAGEDCDDGNRRPNDGCSPQCRQEFCGDGVHQPRLGEQCDGNDVPPLPNGDAQECEFCQIVRCGNGFVQPEAGEECDDGALVNGDGCSQFCRTERCGDFQVLAPENCDDGNRASGDGCSSECRQEFCGDDVVQPRLGEMCDDDSADCNGCVASRACVAGGANGEVCFAIDRQVPQPQNQLFPSSAALLESEGQMQAVFGSLTSSGVLVFELVDGLIGSEQLLFDQSFVALIAVRAADLDADGSDELVVMSNDFTAGVFDIETSSYDRRISFFDRVLDVGSAAVAGDDGLDVVASSRTGQIAVSFADRSVSTVQLDVLCNRVIGAPVRNGRGVAVACGDVVMAMVGKSPNTVSSPLVLDGTREIGAEIRDLAVGDLDGDGIDELVVMTIAPDEMHMLALDGNGLAADAALTFLSATPGGDAVAVDDVDGDGSGDVIVTSERGSMSIHFASAEFAGGSLPVALTATRAASADVDDDGDVDMLVGGSFFQAEALLYVQE